ncbi:MAG: transporter [Negativicutes bacterium]|nr:transporter [Negativicutes bacterium]
MKPITSVAIASMFLVLTAGQVCAGELWDPHLPGIDEGLSAGALPPPGIYGVLNSYSASFSQYDNSGHKTGVKVDAQVEVPVVLWQTGFKVLGADYAMALAKPLDYTNLKIRNDANLSDNGHWGTFNTVLVPGILSWSLPNDFHVKTALVVDVDDASSSPGHPPAGGGLGSGNGFWTVQPELGVSWLHDGWNLSMDAFYSYNFKNTTTQYKSGQQLDVDYTVTKTIGKWTVGMGANQVTQTTSDSGAGAIAAGCPANGGCKAVNFGLGPLLGYQFVGIHVMAEFNRDVYTRNDVGGDRLNIRFSIPISL